MKRWNKYSFLSFLSFSLYDCAQVCGFSGSDISFHLPLIYQYPITLHTSVSFEMWVFNSMSNIYVYITFVCVLRNIDRPWWLAWNQFRCFVKSAENIINWIFNFSRVQIKITSLPIMFFLFSNKTSIKKINTLQPSNNSFIEK